MRATSTRRGSALPRRKWVGFADVTRDGLDCRQRSDQALQCGLEEVAMLYGDETEELRRAESELLHFLGDANHPVETDDVLRELTKRHFSDNSIRFAVWDLLDRSELRVNTEGELEVVPPGLDEELPE